MTEYRKGDRLLYHADTEPHLTFHATLTDHGPVLPGHMVHVDVHRGAEDNPPMEVRLAPHADLGICSPAPQTDVPIIYRHDVVHLVADDGGRIVEARVRSINADGSLLVTETTFPVPDGGHSSWDGVLFNLAEDARNYGEGGCWRPTLDERRRLEDPPPDDPWYSSDPWRGNPPATTTVCDIAWEGFGLIVIRDSPGMVRFEWGSEDPIPLAVAAGLLSAAGKACMDALLDPDGQ